MVSTYNEIPGSRAFVVSFEIRMAVLPGWLTFDRRGSISAM